MGARRTSVQALAVLAVAAGLVVALFVGSKGASRAPFASGTSGTSGVARAVDEHAAPEATGTRLAEPERVDARLEALEKRLAVVERELAERPERGTRPADDIAVTRAELDARIAAYVARVREAEDQGRAVRALTYALARGDADEARSLLAAGLDVNARDDDRRTPLAAAAVAGRIDLVDMLLAAGADLERTSGRRSMTPLLAGLDAIQEETALGLLDRGADPFAVDKNGENALIWAAFNGCERVVRRLLADGADPDFRRHDGGTALMSAAAKGRLEIVRCLLDGGADPNLRDRNGATALVRAVERGQDAVAELLRAYGAR